MIENLQKEAASNDAFKAVCESFAKRQRSRKVLNMQALYNRMHGEGFNYSRKQYGEALKKLANLGLGRIEINRAGRVKALADIPLKLKTIGEFGLTKLEVGAPSKKPKDQPLQIHFSLGGKSFSLTVENEMSAEEIKSLVNFITR